MIEQSITLYPEEIVKTTQTNKTAYYSYGYRDDFSPFEIARELKRVTEHGIKVGNVYKTNLNSVSPATLTVLEILTDPKNISGWDNVPNIIKARRESALYSSKDFTFEYSVDEIIKESELVNV